MRHRTRALIPALAALLVLAPSLTAQVPGRGQADRERLEERVRARMAEMIRERLELTEEEGEALGRVLGEFHGRRRTLHREERSLRERVARWADGEAGSGEDARALLERIVELREEEVRLFRAEQERLLAVLTPEQLVAFHALRDRMSQRIRELRSGSDRPRRPRGPPDDSFPRGWEL